jgi:hypothetical protein
MQKLMSGLLVVVFFALTSGTLAQHQGTAMTSLPQPDAPAFLVETTHGTKDLLKSARLKNRSSERITGYRIGWIAVYPTGKDRVGLGFPVELPLGVSPGATIEVPAQRVSMDNAQEGALAVIFFVTDVRTRGQNSTTESSVWRPALEKLEEQALALTKSTISSTQ